MPSCEYFSARPYTDPISHLLNLFDFLLSKMQRRALASPARRTSNIASCFCFRPGWLLLCCYFGMPCATCATVATRRTADFGHMLKVSRVLNMDIAGCSANSFGFSSANSFVLLCMFECENASFKSASDSQPRAERGRRSCTGSAGPKRGQGPHLLFLQGCSTASTSTAHHRRHFASGTSKTRSCAPCPPALHLRSRFLVFWFSGYHQGFKRRVPHEPTP